MPSGSVSGLERGLFLEFQVTVRSTGLLDCKLTLYSVHNVQEVGTGHYTNLGNEQSHSCEMVQYASRMREG